MARRFCPYLGLRDEAETHISYPSYDNFCYASGERRVVSMSEQARFCLSGQHETCYQFVVTARGRGRGSGPETSTRPPPRPPRQVEARAEKKMAQAPAPIPTTRPPEHIASQQVGKRREQFCSHLGSLSNKTVHAGYPSYNNFCYVSGRRHTVPMAHQGKFCLRSEFTACPRLMAVPQGDTPKRDTPLVPEPVKEAALKARPEAPPKPKPTLAQPIDIVAIANLAIQGKFSEAIAETERVTGALDSDLARSLVWGLLVSSYSEATGDLVSDFVFSCWKKALDLDPGNFRPYYGLAFYYAGYEDYPNALWAASQVLELAPKDDPAYNGIWQFIGMVEQKIGTRAVERYLARQDV